MTDASVRKGSGRARSIWSPTLGLSLGLLLLAAGLALAKSLGQGPAHLQTGHQVSTSYVGVLVYEYAGLPAAGVILLAWLFLVTVVLKRFRERTGRRTALIAGGVGSLALLWAGSSVVQQLFVGYTHLQSLTADGNDYHLGIRTALDGDFFFVVTQCPRRQVRCVAQGVSAVDAAERADLSHVRLVVDTAQALIVRTSSRSIPVRRPPL